MSRPGPLAMNISRILPSEWDELWPYNTWPDFSPECNGPYDDGSGFERFHLRARFGKCLCGKKEECVATSKSVPNPKDKLPALKDKLALHTTSEGCDRPAQASIRSESSDLPPFPTASSTRAAKRPLRADDDGVACKGPMKDLSSY